MPEYKDRNERVRQTGFRFFINERVMYRGTEWTIIRVAANSFVIRDDNGHTKRVNPRQIELAVS